MLHCSAMITRAKLDQNYILTANTKKNLANKDLAEQKVKANQPDLILVTSSANVK